MTARLLFAAALSLFSISGCERSPRPDAGASGSDARLVRRAGADI